MRWRLCNEPQCQCLIFCRRYVFFVECIGACFPAVAAPPPPLACIRNCRYGNTDTAVLTPVIVERLSGRWSVTRMRA